MHQITEQEKQLIGRAVSGMFSDTDLAEIMQKGAEEHWPTPADKRPFGDALRGAWAK